MVKVNILIVEDDDDDIREWENALKRHNALAESKGYDIKFSAKFAKSLSEARSVITEYNFSVSIIDIRLEDIPENQHLNTDGIDVVQEIMECNTSLVTIYTGQKTDAESSINPQQQEYIKVIDKSERSKQELLFWLSQENTALINSIIEIKDNFSTVMAELFYSSVWPRWKYWIKNDGLDSAATQAALHRHMATHLHASHQNTSSTAHPEEYYFIPALKEQLDTGDILRLGEDIYVIASARCDLARRQNETFHLVKLDCIQSRWNELFESGSNSAKGKLKNIIDHDKSPKKHFIPQIKLSDKEVLGPFLANFNWIRCEENSAKISAEFLKCRIASLSNEFVPSLVDRLGTYFGRIGDPDYPKPE